MNNMLSLLSIVKSIRTWPPQRTAVFTGWMPPIMAPPHARRAPMAVIRGPAETRRRTSTIWLVRLMKSTTAATTPTTAATTPTTAAMTPTTAATTPTTAAMTPTTARTLRKRFLSLIPVSSMLQRQKAFNA